MPNDSVCCFCMRAECHGECQNETGPILSQLPVTEAVIDLDFVGTDGTALVVADFVDAEGLELVADDVVTDASPEVLQVAEPASEEDLRRQELSDALQLARELRDKKIAEANADCDAAVTVAYARFQDK